MNWYLGVLKKYAVFNGRARRKEYWMFVLFNIVISVVLRVIDSLSGTISPGASVGLLGGLYFLAVLIPGIAVSVRRLHDTNHSGWWLLISLVPLINLVFLILMMQDSQSGENQYGPNPKFPTFMESLTKRCPRCAETINIEDTQCPHCDHPFNTDEMVEQIRSVLDRRARDAAAAVDFSSSMKRCPNCTQSIRFEALVCRHCKHEFTDAAVQIAKVRTLRDAEYQRVCEVPGNIL